MASSKSQKRNPPAIDTTRHCLGVPRDQSRAQAYRSVNNAIAWSVRYDDTRWIAWSSMAADSGTGGNLRRLTIWKYVPMNVQRHATNAREIRLRRVTEPRSRAAILLQQLGLPIPVRPEFNRRCSVDSVIV